MSPDWKRLLVSDLADKSPRSTASGPFGSNLVSKDYTDAGVPVIRGVNMSNGRWVGGDFAFVSEEKAEQLSSNHAYPGELIFTQRGTLGQVCLVPHGPVKKYVISQSQMKLRVDPTVCDPLFMLYQFRSPEQQEYIDMNAIRVGVPHTNLGILRGTPCHVPPLSDQKVIAHILGTLDDKIELNQKTSETLKGIAKSLFKSWFVDFDPVTAKAKGRPTGLPDEISELFPDSFQESELGEIPNEWGCRQLRELIESVKDRQGDRLLEEFSATVSGIEPRDDRFKKNLAKSSNKNRVAHEGDLVFGLSRRVINFGRMSRSIGAFSPVYEVFRSLPGAPISTKFIEEHIRQRMNEFMIILKPAAREGQAIDREILLDQSVSIAPEKVITAFEVLAVLVESRIKSLAENTNVLGHMRDALLPRLISGELRVPDAEKMLEEVGI